MAIGFLTFSAWVYTVFLAFEMSSGTRPMMAAVAMPRSMDWSRTDFFYLFTMWCVMMIAMMLPSATPMILLFEKVGQRRVSQNRASVAPSVFMAGYLIVWLFFSLAATLLNWLFHGAGLMTSMMGQATPLVAGSLLIAAGIFQWTPLKHTCLTHCRSPIGFLTAQWQEGHTGALRMGIHHGVYCVGCCWLLMVLLFVLGVMNVVWIAVLAVFVLLEKVVPYGLLLSRLTGVALVVWGGIVLLTGL